MKRISGYEVTPLTNNQFCLADGSPFDVEAYSLMKYGDGKQAWLYGNALARAAIAETSDSLSQENVLFTVPACVYAPKPALAVARAMLTSVNEWRAENDLIPAKSVRMYSAEMGRTNYAQSSQEERRRELQGVNRQRHLPPELVKDATVFMVDDCIITGETERSQADIICKHQPAEILSAAAIIVDPQKALEFPGVEHVMNTAGNPNLQAVWQLVQQGRFVLNSRVLKLILQHDNPAELHDFFVACPWALQHEIYESCMNSTLDFIEEYALPIRQLQRVMQDSDKDARP